MSLFNFAQIQSVTSSDAESSLVFAVVAVVAVLLFIFSIVGIVGVWKTFVKAGKPGWASIVPYYNYIVMAEVAGRPWWWGLGYLISPLNLYVSIQFGMDIAKKFGKSDMFGIVALGLFSPVGFLIIGTGQDQYNPKIGVNQHEA